ncbi:MAG: hypothetical protein K0Q72_2168 [Armatimonadetes bacterium]|jgi:hypothetical protein|nr:hypothetical protein [Armatimonadota bacterium]
MRNFLMGVAATVGAWMMAQCALQWAGAAAPQFGTGPNPATGLLIGTALLLGALGGALLAGLLYPR